MADETETTTKTKSYDEAYVSGLRAEAKGYREETNAARARAEAAEVAAAKATTDAATSLAAAHAATAEAQARGVAAIREAALKIAAKDAGMIDLDGLKILDTSAVKVDDAGNVTIPDAFFVDAKKAKSYLFAVTGADTGTTTTTAKTPTPKETGKVVDAMTMSNEEYAAAKAVALRTR